MAFPRRELSFKYTRHQFWRALLQEILAMGQVVNGAPDCRLSELGNLPDEALAAMRPVVAPGVEISVQDEFVWGLRKSEEQAEPVQLFAITPENLAVFNRFNGQHTLRETAQAAAHELGWEEPQAWAHARDLFLLLVNHLICIPQDPLEEQGAHGR